MLSNTLCLAVVAVVFAAVSSTAAAVGNFPPIWPYPSNFTSGSASMVVDSVNFKFSSNLAQSDCPDVYSAFSRFAPVFFPNSQPRKSALLLDSMISGVLVTVLNCSVPLQLGVDESYSLEVDTNGGDAKVVAPTVYGAYHALQTLSQLITFDFDTKRYSVPFAPWFVTDAPRFSHREVLVDTARHWQPLPKLREIIDSLTQAKLNVLHWHIVDSQSFPFESKTYPELASAGSYSSMERYSTEDVEDIVEFARARGVRVMPEVDTPGHAASFCAGHPEVCPSASCLEPLNPATEATFDLLRGLFSDITGGSRGSGLFPDNLMHLGGDEVNTKCWSETPSIAAWMSSKGFSPDQSYEYFVQRAQSIAHSQGRDVVGWEEIWNHFGTQLDLSTIIHQWLPGSTVAKNCTSHGYRVLWSTDGVWYLDGLETTWQTMYAQEPCTGIEPAVCAKLVLGGGGEMWGETVDASDLISTVWPRAAAIAERLWSPQSVTDIDAASPRYSAFRCLLNKRGFGAAPSNNKVARSSPPSPGGCFAQ